MNTNLLLAISVILVGTILISINYSAMSSLYLYSAPLSSFAVERLSYASDPGEFEKVKQQEGSTCFVTPTSEYCFKEPRGDKEFRVSYLVNADGISGEMHFEPAGNATGYWTMKEIVPISDNAAVFTFSDNSDRYPRETLAKWNIDEKFEFTKTVQKYDTFVSHCSNDGRHIEIVQYAGIFSVENFDYVVTWHVGASSDKGITCKYPEIIQHSFGHDFGI